MGSSLKNEIVAHSFFTEVGEQDTEVVVRWRGAAADQMVTENGHFKDCFQ